MANVSTREISDRYWRAIAIGRYVNGTATTEADYAKKLRYGEGWTPTSGGASSIKGMKEIAEHDVAASKLKKASDAHYAEALWLATELRARIQPALDAEEATKAKLQKEQEARDLQATGGLTEEAYNNKLLDDRLHTVQHNPAFDWRKELVVNTPEQWKTLHDEYQTAGTESRLAKTFQALNIPQEDWGIASQVQQTLIRRAYAKQQQPNP